MREQNIVCISEPLFSECFLTLGFEVKSEAQLIELLTLEWCQRAGNDAISERNALSEKYSDLKISIADIMRINFRNVLKVAQLAPPIALSQKLAGIDTELWEQNDTIDQAVKALVEQGHLIYCFIGMMQQLASRGRLRIRKIKHARPSGRTGDSV